MKKSLILLMAAVFLISAAPFTAGAAAFNNAVRLDFSDFQPKTTSGSMTYKTYFSVGNNAMYAVPETITDERGVSVKMLCPRKADSDQYVNWYAAFTKNAVFGLSVQMKDTAAAFGIALKGVSGNWDDTSISANDLIYISNGTVKLNSSPVYSYTNTEWMDIIIAMNYETHNLYLYINGNLAGTKVMHEEVTGTQYMNIAAAKGAENADGSLAAFYIDDFLSYYPSNAAVTNDFKSSIINAEDTDSITLDFEQSVVIDDLNSAVAVNGEYAQITPIYKYGFITGAKVELNGLVPKTDYTVTLNGVKNLINENVEYSYSFSTIDDSPMVSVSSDYQGKKLPEGSKISVNISSANLEADDIIEIYVNGESAAQVPSDAKTANIILQGGINSIYAKVSGTSVVSDTIEVEAIGYTVTDSGITTDFNDGTFGAISTKDKKEGILEIRDSDAEHGKSLYFEYDGHTTESGQITGEMMPFFCYPTVTGKKGIYVAEFEFMTSDTTSVATSLFNFKTDKNGWNSGQIQVKNGAVTVSGTPVKSDIQPETWYKMKVMYNTENKTASLFVNDELVSYEAQLANEDFETVQYINQALGVKGGQVTWQYIDNVKAWFWAENFECGAQYADSEGNICGADEVSYESAAVKLTFETEMNAASFEGLSVVDANGNKTALSGGVYTYETDSSGNVLKNEYTASVQGLKSNMNYYIDMENVTSSLGGKFAGKAEFKTEKSPFCIDSVTYSSSSGILTVKVNIRNVSGETQTASITAGAYGDIAMYSVDAKNISTAGDTSYTFIMTEPKDDYTVEVYMFDNMNNLNIVDKAVSE